MNLSRQLPRFGLGAILLLTLTAYLKVFTFEFVDWDDLSLIVRNPLTQYFNPAIFWTFEPELYAPLTLFTFQIEHFLAGFDPTIFHATNLILHLINIILVYKLTSLITRHSSFVLIATALFALHPIQVETVAWVSARKELLWTLFGLLALISYIRETSDKRRETWLPRTFLFTLLALLCKPTAVVLPFLMLLIDGKEENISVASLKRKWPLLGLIGLFGLVGLLGKIGSTTDLSILGRLLLIPAGIVFAFRLLFWPFGSAVIHPAPDPIGITSMFYGAALLSVIILCTLLWQLRHRDRAVTFGLTFFLLALLPGLLSPIHAEIVTVLTEHYLYMPMIGLGIVLIALLERIPYPVSRIALPATLGLAVVFTPLTIRATNVWSDSATLFEHEREIYPRNATVLTNLGAAYARMERYTEAESILRQAVTLDPNMAQAHFNFGGVRYVRGDYEGAIDAYLKTLRLKPEHVDALRLLTWSYFRNGDLGEARRTYEKTMALDPAQRSHLPEIPL